MSAKKGFWIGAAVGVLLVPVTTLGLVIPFVGEIGRFILVVPRLATSLLIDTETTSGAVTVPILAVLSGLFFGGIGLLCVKLTNRQGKPAEGPESEQ